MAKRKEPKRYPLIEWISAGVGLVITSALLAMLIVETVQERDGVPPLLEVEPTQLTKSGRLYVLEFNVTNGSSATGASVAVEGALMAGSSQVERSSATLAYVPGKSSQRGGLIFTQDPRRHQLELRVTGYERP